MENVLEKILEEIKEAFDENIDDIEDSAGIHHFAIDSFTAWYIARKIIRSHMDDVPKCGECSRKKLYQIGYEDGKKDKDWISIKEVGLPKLKLIMEHEIMSIYRTKEVLIQTEHEKNVCSFLSKSI